jgi:hypothetical protein
MKILKVLIAAFLIIFIGITVCEAFSWFSSTSASTSLPTVPVKFPFDVSKRDSKVSQEFRIGKVRYCCFGIQFNFFGQEDLFRVLALVGDGSREYPGINIPIHLKIIKLNTGNLPSKLIYENTITTKHSYAGCPQKKKGDGCYSREIKNIYLESGIYRVEASTIEDKPEFSGTQSYLKIEYPYHN